MNAGTVKVTVLPYRAVFVDDRMRRAGEELELPADEAQTLLDDGFVERTGEGAPAKAPARRRGRQERSG
jgi:hypothetical protein